MQLQVKKSPFGFKLDDLMVPAKRLNNPKRSFLFVSKVLGKHLEIEPGVNRQIGYLLATLLYGTVDDFTRGKINYDALISGEKVSSCIPYTTSERVCVLGFAETATGLGMAVAAAIEGAYYLHTTRERLTNQISWLDFAEEHSHATDHYCFPEDEGEIQRIEHLVLVDDELTTGQSILNLLKGIIKKTTIKKFTVLTILDWRNETHQQMLEEFSLKHNISLQVLSIIHGKAIENENKTYHEIKKSQLLKKEITDEYFEDLSLFPRIEQEVNGFPVSFYRDSGRFGVTYENVKKLDAYFFEAASAINQKLLELNMNGERILVIGHGEDMYIPCSIAEALAQQMQVIVHFKTTTRSPILTKHEIGYPIKESHHFFDQEDTQYFCYNLGDVTNNYDAVIFIVEKPLRIRLVDKQITIQL